MRLNLRFIAAVKFHPQPMPMLAELCDVDSSDLSELVNLKRMPKENDPTVLKVGEMLGFKPEDCFIADLPEPEDAT